MDKKSEMIKVSVTEETKKHIKQQAEKQGLSLSSWARTKIRKHLPQQVEA